MLEQGSGAIVNCSSLGGLVGLPSRAAYHATRSQAELAITGLPMLSAPRGARLLSARASEIQLIGSIARAMIIRIAEWTCVGCHDRLKAFLPEGPMVRAPGSWKVSG